MRWKAFIFFIIFCLITVVFYIFFLDNVLKAAFIKANELIFQSRVTVSDLHFSLKDNSITINDYQVPDKDNLAKNLFEINTMRGDLQFMALLKKSVLINELSAVNINFNTKRKTAALPLKKKKKKKRKTKKKKKPSKFQLMKKKIAKTYTLDFDVNKIPFDKIIEPTALSTVKLAEDFKSESEEKINKWQEITKNFNLDKEIEAVKTAGEDLESVKDIKTLEDVLNFKKKLEELKDKKEVLENKYNEFKQIKNDYKRDKDYFQTNLKKIKQGASKFTDYKKILSAVNLQDLDIKDISKIVFSSKLSSLFQTTYKWVLKFRRLLPEKKEKKKKIKITKGIDVKFPKTKKEIILPKFLIKQIKISGNCNISEKEFKINGLINNVTFEQKTYGKPLTININGSGDYDFSAKAALDYRGESHKENIILEIKNLPLEGQSLGSGDFFPPEFSEGEAMFNVDTKFQEDDYSSEFFTQLGNLKFKKDKAKLDNEFKKIVFDIYNNIGTIDLKGSINYVNNDLKFKVSSNLDKQFKKALSDVWNKKMDEAKARVKKEVDDRIKDATKYIQKEINEKLKELEKNILGKDKNYLKEIDLSTADIKKYTDMSNNKNLIKEKADKEIAEKKEEAKEAAKEFIKSLF
ncbi:TIGR03545 family protein [bacterium]